MGADLESLLRASAAASAENLTMRTWQLTNEFALKHWVADPDSLTAVVKQLPSDVVGDYWLMRAAVAENTGCTYEAAVAYSQLLERGDSAVANRHNSAGTCTKDIVRADLAWASLSFLQPGEEALVHLAERLERWRGGSFRTVPSTDASLIASTAMLGHTVEVGTQTPNSDRLTLYVEIAEAYGSHNPTQADRLLWRAQQAHGAGDIAGAQAMAHQVIALGTETGDEIARFEGHDMLGNFALMAVDEPDITRHFAMCFDIVSKHGAPVIALQRAASASWAAFSAGQIDFAAQLATRALAACDQMPNGDAQQNLLTVLGNCALERGDTEEAEMWAARVRERAASPGE